MMNVRHKNERGETQIDWLKSWHSFSFGEYRDREHMGFGPLRVINEDIVAPGQGFGMHGHANMEIITYVLSGALQHKDSLGNGDIIRPGDVQVMSAGKGILHSEFNPSPDTPVHLLQIWIMPKETGTRPGYQQKTFDPEGFNNRWNLLVSPDGSEGSLPILQDARIWATRLDGTSPLSFKGEKDKKYWLQIARGAVTINNRNLTAGDGLFVDNETIDSDIRALEASEALLFELPR
jgi:redox-sensitive bicupin YhaK (pirin superfamily)